MASRGGPCVCFDPECPGIPSWLDRWFLWAFGLTVVLATVAGIRFALAFADAWVRMRGLPG